MKKNLKLNWQGVGKKIIDETAGLLFTLAGSVVVFITLSGQTRTIAIVATAIALVLHYAHALFTNDID